jgi:hypothetical protein
MSKSKEYVQGYLDCAANIIPIQMLLAFMHQNNMTHQQISKATHALYNFNPDTYEYIKPARLEKFTKGLCLDFSSYEKTTIAKILGLPISMFEPPENYKRA